MKLLLPVHQGFLFVRNLSYLNKTSLSICLYAFHRFTKSQYVTRVSSPLPADTPVLRLLAVDHDIGTNALLKFSITGGNDGGHFKIDSATGIISSGQSFSSNEQKTFMLAVQVSDSGAKHIFKDSSSVKVRLLSVLLIFVF